MKLLLCCTKTEPYLFKTNNRYCLSNENKTAEYVMEDFIKSICINGKIVAECDFEVEEIGSYDYVLGTETLDENNLLERSCLSLKDIIDYLKPEKCSLNNGYAIHIKNLKIFDEPKELSDYYKQFTTHTLIGIDKPPKNMMYAYEYEERNNEDYYNMNILVPFHPEQLCKILNGECTIILKKKVLKEML